jgi:phage major head subunit gpT-like protein
LFDLISRGTSEKCYDGQPFFSAAHLVAKGTTSNLDVASAGDVPTRFLLDTTKAVKPFILQIRTDYDFVTLDKSENDHVFMRREFVYGVEDRLNVGFGLWQLAFASSKALTAADAAMAWIFSFPLPQPPAFMPGRLSP